MAEIDDILTSEERKKLRSMSTYWREVRGREDTSPLEHEINQVYHMLGINLLFIVARYIELTEGE